MQSLLHRCWRSHSKTVVSLASGSAGLIGARYAWPDGGVDFDLVTAISGILVAFGLQGVIDYWFRETNRPED